MQNKSYLYKVAVIGLGLIGGSIARRLAEQNCFVIGFDKSAEVIRQALADNVLSLGSVWPDEEPLPDEISALDISDLSENRNTWQHMSDCDVVFICTPPEYVASAAVIVRAWTDALITDAASVKGPVMNAVKDRRFVGGHPMAGSEKTGYRHSQSSLLENAAYVICVPDNSSLTVLELKRLESIVSLTGASVFELDWQTHDQAVAAISHLPHAAAAALCLLAARQADDSLSRLAAGGFRDITRIASSNPELWAAISMESGSQLLRLVDEYIQVLQEFRQALSAEDRKALEKFFFQASRFRSSLPVDGRGALNAPGSLTVYVNDRPGELGRITTLLGSNRINISNIRIKEFRAYEGGCLQLLLSDSAQAVKAAWLLREAGYECD